MKAIIAILMLLYPAVWAYGMSLEYSQELLNRGKNYLLGDSINPDSAIICFSRVADSYRVDLPLKQRELCGTAANNLGFTYYQYVQDYQKAYEALLKAEEICDDTGRPLTTVNVYLNLGNLYSVFSEHVGSPELEDEAIKMYQKAFDVACDNELYQLICSSFCNLTELGQDFNHIDSQRDIIERFGRISVPEGTPLSGYAKLRYEALKAFLDDDKIKATDFLIKSIDNVDDDVTPYPWGAQAVNLTAALYLDREMPDSAKYYTDILLDDTFGDWSCEVRANAYKLQKKIYEYTGDTERAHEVYGKLLMIQDSLMNVNHLGTIDNLKFINELAAERQRSALMLAEAERKKKVRELILLFAGLLLAIVTPLLLVILNRHRKLRKSYIDLYNKYQEILSAENENRKHREEEMRMLIQGQEKIISDETKESTSYVAPQSAISQKTRILAVMDESDEIFSADFSLERLADLVGISSRALSAVLNDSLGTSFRELLNQYRVREACKRLSDEQNYGHLTIEAISQSVGYKSRTSLVTAFKKETGLTPSDYQRIARTTKS